MFCWLTVVCRILTQMSHLWGIDLRVPHLADACLQPLHAAQEQQHLWKGDVNTASIAIWGLEA